MNCQAIRGVLFVAVVVLLAGCGGGDSPSPTTTVAPPTATSAPPTATPAPVAEDQATEAASPIAADIRSFVIDSAQSEARFLIDELLLGAPTEVQGVTSQLTGTIDIDLNAPVNTTVSQIIVDARDLKTDRNLRDRAIRRFILQSADDNYQFITFTPTAIEGLPTIAEPGDSFAFAISGELQIRDILQPVTFEVTLTAESDTQIAGLAQATVQRSDFDLQIPSAPGVADVSEEVRLELEFVATMQEAVADSVQRLAAPHR